jgi:FkbM family methyltransferase
VNASRLGIAAVALGIAAAVCFVEPVKLSVIVLLRRNSVCPWEQALKAAENERRQIAIKDKILYASKLLEKDPKGFHLWQTPHGRYWIPKGSDYVLPFNLAEQERKIYGTGARAVQPDDIVLDCGANIGVFVREALNSGAKLVVAVEPAPENIECLRRNFPSEIEDGKVIVYPKGVWDKDDILTLNVDPANSAADSFLIRREGALPIAQIPLTTIDKLVAELNLPRVDYIKMDIEGAEPNALQGAQTTLAKFTPRLSLSAYHAPDHPKRIPELVRRASAGYRMECGPCAETRFAVRPDILYFFPEHPVVR